MKIFFTLIFSLFIQYANAADPKYPVSAISANLREGVDVVVRQERTTFTIISKSQATLTVYEVYTILNERGKRYASEVIGYDKLVKVNYFKATAYDAVGNVIKKLKNSEIYDQSAYDGFSLYSDNRLKAAEMSQGTYPYTVEFEYELEYKYLFQIPTFTILAAEKVAVEKSSYTLHFPFNLAPRYKALNIHQDPVISDLNGIKTVSWNFENVKPLTFEPYGPFKSQLIPHILAAPSQFSYEGYEGMMNSWDQFGKWIGSLNKGRDVLPEETRHKIKALTASLNSREEKVKAVYQYLQDKTRYVSIQLGIGGFQPFEATVVDKTGYGDCKALSNYAVAMLEVAGIKANYTLINAGEHEPGMITDFPSSQFNHVIVAVPSERDTLWLECTSQVNPFGYLGRFTGDRRALMITEDGAKIIKTPTYTASQNTQIRVAEVQIDKQGNAKAKVKTVYAGLQYENDHLNSVLGDRPEDQKKWIQNNTQIPSFDINSFSMENRKDKLPSAAVEFNLTLNRFATVSGKRIFVTPNLMNRSTFVPEKITERKTNVVRRMAYTDIDTIRYALPEDIYPEFLPEPVRMKSVFGEYESSFKIDQGSLLYVRKVKMNKGEYPADSYNQLIDFYKGMNKADNIKMVFISKT
jgi:transglutaminase-like putative cysteine protease